MILASALAAIADPALTTRPIHRPQRTDDSAGKSTEPLRSGLNDQKDPRAIPSSTGIVSDFLSELLRLIL